MDLFIKYEDIGHKIDAASQTKDSVQLTILAELCRSKIAEEEEAEQQVILYFFQANCHSALRKIDYEENKSSQWNWESENSLKEVLSLRNATVLCNEKTDPILYCKIYTNLGNILNQLGRFIEAINCWDKALEVIPNFAMAIGNKANAMYFYTYCLYDPGQQLSFLFKSLECIELIDNKNLVWDSGLDNVAYEGFQALKKSLENVLKNYDTPVYQKYSLGDDKNEVAYRQWCLSNKLFLNPLNDVCLDSFVGHDVLHLPDHIYNFGEEPVYPKYYNLLKQEYVSARYKIYQFIEGSLNSVDPFNDVLLINNFDGAFPEIENEEGKSGYRVAYSLFDKVAAFLNHYLMLKHDIRGVSFRQLWVEHKFCEVSGAKKYILKDGFVEKKNWPLRGLYYVSQDIYSKDFQSTSSPDSSDLKNIRDYIEHRFLSITYYENQANNDTDCNRYISKRDFSLKAIKILSMAREALIYLSLAIHEEEKHKSKDDPNEYIPSFQSQPY